MQVGSVVRWVEQVSRKTSEGLVVSFDVSGTYVCVERSDGTRVHVPISHLKLID